MIEEDIEALVKRIEALEFAANPDLLGRQAWERVGPIEFLSHYGQRLLAMRIKGKKAVAVLEEGDVRKLYGHLASILNGYK